MSALRKPTGAAPLYQVVEAPNLAHVPAVAVLRDGVAVAYRFGRSKAHARRRGILAMAKMLEKDLTGIYQR